MMRLFAASFDAMPADVGIAVAAPPLVTTSATTIGGRAPFLAGLDGTGTEYALVMLILGIILFGMLIGAAAQLIVGRSAKGVDWGLALAAGLVGSFIGGLVVSLISGDGVVLRPSGIIGSLAGAIIVTFAWQWWRRRGAESRR